MGLFLGGYTTAFATPIGGHQLIEVALAQRGANNDPSSPISQVSPSSPSFSPATADIAQLPFHPMNALPTMTPQPMQRPQMPQMPQQPQKVEPSQENIIIQALVKQLERNHEAKKLGINGGMTQV